MKKLLAPALVFLATGCAVIPGGERPAPDRPSVYRAIGTEPGWSLTIRGGRMDYDGDYGERKISVSRPEPRTTFNGHRYETPRLTVDVTHGQCSDGMSDRIFADTVTVTADGKTVKGCGGDIIPPSDLSGTNWTIESVGGVPATKGRPATLAFTPDKASGSSGCNRFSGSYQLNTTVLTLSPVMATKMACIGPVMDQENALFAILKGPLGIRMRGDTLILTSENGRSVVLKRAI